MKSRYIYLLLHSCYKISVNYRTIYLTWTVEHEPSIMSSYCNFNTPIFHHTLTFTITYKKSKNKWERCYITKIRIGYIGRSIRINLNICYTIRWLSKYQKKKCKHSCKLTNNEKQRLGIQTKLKEIKFVSQSLGK